MPEADCLDGLLACPRCDRALTASAAAWACPACRVEFPLLDDLPCLFAEPAYALAEWRSRFALQLRELEHDAARAEHALANETRSALTRERLAGLREACLAQAQQLRELLAPLDVPGSTAARETYLALRTRLPPGQGLLSYAANVHRDWCWGAAENQASRDLVLDALGGAAHDGRLLVLGAGAGRLAYDLHEQADPALTLGLDFNPLMLLIAQRVARGEALELIEFPLAPRRLVDQAVRRTLKAPAPARAGFRLLLADALRPPLVAGSLDAVVTPWLVDILPEQLPLLAARINGLLRPGGRWITFGSLAFGPEDATARLSFEEVLEAIHGAGFSPPSHRHDTLPYLCSPASSHGRHELVATIAADKRSEVKAPPRYAALPDWLVTGKEPVPLLEAFKLQAASTRIHAFLMSLIDGRRSLEDMARLMEEQRLMTRAEALPALRGFLTKMYDESRASGG